MGMDVCGFKPRNKQGEYFRNNVWYWRPLADYVCEVAPEITSACRHWQSNDGDGLTDADSVALADALQLRLDSGETAEWEMIFASEKAKIPKEPCRGCGGTGTRAIGLFETRDPFFDKAPCDVYDGTGTTLPIGLFGTDNPVDGKTPCRACDGAGQVYPADAYYGFKVENVASFVAFLRQCGGFGIW
jgi:hypothetical protein